MSKEHRSRSLSTPGTEREPTSSLTGQQQDPSPSTTQTEPGARVTKTDRSALVTVCANPGSRKSGLPFSRRVFDVICFPVVRKPKSSRVRSVSAPAPAPPLSASSTSTTDATPTTNNEAPSSYVTFPVPAFHTGGQPRAFDSRIPTPDDVWLPPACHPFWIDPPPVPRHRAHSLAPPLRRSRRSRRPRKSSVEGDHA